MTDDQYAQMLAVMQYTQADSDQMAAGVARLQSHEAALFVAVAVLIGFVIVMWLTLAMQGRPRSH